MAATVNGFGYGGDVGGQRGHYYLKTINASSSVLNNINDPSNNTPPISRMQKLLDIDGSGRLLLLAPYGNGYYASRDTWISGDGMTTEEAKAGSVNHKTRVRIEADDRVIYKASNMVRVQLNLPTMIVDSNFHMFTHLSSYPLTLAEHLTLRLPASKHPEIPGSATDLTRVIQTDSIASHGTHNSSDTYDPYSFDWHFLEKADEGRMDVLDYGCSVVPGGLFFDDNLTIYAAYGNAPASDFPNGILVLYQLFDED